MRVAGDDQNRVVARECAGDLLQFGAIDGDRERPRFDNPFLSEATRDQIRAAYAQMGLDAPMDDDVLALRRNLLDLGGRQHPAQEARVGRLAHDKALAHPLVEHVGNLIALLHGLEPIKHGLRPL